MKAFRTRRGKLKEKLETILGQHPDMVAILDSVDEYEKNNLDTIKKLNRKKVVTLRKINGGIKQTIGAHGPITMELIGSCTKRIYGNLLEDKKHSFFVRLVRTLFKIK